MQAEYCRAGARGKEGIGIQIVVIETKKPRVYVGSGLPSLNLILHIPLGSASKKGVRVVAVFFLSQFSRVVLGDIVLQGLHKPSAIEKKEL